MLACALCVLALVGVIIYELASKSSLSWHAFGWRFFLRSEWDPVNEQFGALPFIYGTIVSSLLALIIAVPLAVGVAVFLTEMCSALLRAPLCFLTELLAAIPSVIYGLWAIFVLVPLLRLYVQPLLQSIWAGPASSTARPMDRNAGGGNHSRHHDPADHLLAHPRGDDRGPAQQREAVLALGATRWEMIRMGVLRNARIGIVGAIILGLGRALGETMAVTM